MELDEFVAADWDSVAELLKQNEIKQVYVPDTNVFISNGDAVRILSGTEKSDKTGEDDVVHSHEPNAVVILSTVRNELDVVKGNPKKDEFAKMNARYALRGLEEIARTGFADGKFLRQGVLFGDNGSKAVVFAVQYSTKFIPDDVGEPSPDDKIVFTALEVQNELKSRLPEIKVVFVSNDYNARTTAYMCGLAAEEFRHEAVQNPEILYPGYQIMEASEATYDLFFASSHLSVAGSELERISESLAPDQVLLLEHPDKLNKPTLVGLVDVDCNGISGFKYFSESLFKPVRKSEEIESQNDVADEPVIELSRSEKRNCRKQKKNRPNERKRREEELRRGVPPHYNSNLRFSPLKSAFMELLLNPDVDCVSVIGKAGSGKTLCSLLAGIYQVDKNVYQSVTYLRHLDPLGKDIGALPGNLNEKMNFWAKPVFDNLGVIFDCNQPSDQERIERYIRVMREKKRLVITPTTNIRGATFYHTFLIVDEAHNITRDAMKLIVSRCGDGTKLVVIGDPSQIVSDHYSVVTPSANGLVQMVSRLAGKAGFEWRYAHLYLSEDEILRSRLAKMSCRL